ncbi:RagB/SusD family nutrient uptake outer membrane protein [uncultured Winogradskyella sp.]|uniref:RagB/SusD family nutrient uptake outer membrane protein n=1 Tax=uncultured Winogradskyella sp. TaxID=395353 RepID=UPI002628EF03|nr:RagB/SusD family nutrient uptake outer membrane protein [uncultured Winogradskyella sp.]
MKKVNSYILTLLFLFLFSLNFTSCSNDIELEDLYDELDNVDPENIALMLDDLYSKMYSTSSGGSTRIDDFGQKGYDIYSDVLTGDMAVNYTTYGWYKSITSFESTMDSSHESNTIVWFYYYNIIETANTVIGELGGSNSNPADEMFRHYLGQALALRSYAYFYLSQFMSNDYNPSSEILPLYLEGSDTYIPKSATQEVFQQIENDLNRAIELLDNYQRPSKLNINKFVAQSILAYTIAAQRDQTRFNEVVLLCDEVIATSGASIMNSTEVTNGFNNVQTPGWIWGVNLTQEMDIVYSWWTHMDYFTFGYSWAGDNKTIDQNLYNSIPNEDVRKEQFYSVVGDNYLAPLDKFYDDERLPGNDTNTLETAYVPADSDYVFIRIAELYILKAESLAKLGQEAAARSTLSEVLSLRLSDTSYLNSLSGSSLQDEIFLQTRIEFWGEGKTYLALKRNEENTGIRGNNHNYFIGQTFIHYDERLTFEIPQSVIESNPFINEQN